MSTLFYKDYFNELNTKNTENAFDFGENVFNKNAEKALKIIQETPDTTLKKIERLNSVDPNKFFNNEIFNQEDVNNVINKMCDAYRLKNEGENSNKENIRNYLELSKEAKEQLNEFAKKFKQNTPNKHVFKGGSINTKKRKTKNQKILRRRQILSKKEKYIGGDPDYITEFINDIIKKEYDRIKSKNPLKILTG